MAITDALSNPAKRALLELQSRKTSAIAMFRPTEQQEPFFRRIAEDGVLEVLLGGGNRSGKTTCVAVAVAAAALNQPVTLRDGTKLHMRPDRWRETPLKMWVVGLNWTHIGKTFHRVFFRKDLFKVIRDQKTGQWRTFDPTRPDDRGTEHLTRPSPPLLRVGEDVLRESMSWENRKERQLSSFEMVGDGSRVELFASTGERPQGDPAHMIWIDERLDDEEWYDELLARLIDHKGRLIWTSWPSTAPSEKMAALEERASHQVGDPKAKSFVFRLKGSENPYTQSEHRDAILATMDEDQREARDGGTLNMARWMMYPRFSRVIHRAVGPDPAGDDALAKAIRACNGIPGTWTRYLILDPGTANPGIVFVAIPPPEIGNFIVPYDELYLHYAPARDQAAAVAKKTMGQMFEDFIIDSHAARQTPMGFDLTIGENYERAFEEYGLRSRRRGSRFSYGSDNPATRIFGLQGAMNIRDDGTTCLRILGCPQLVKQLEMYKRKADPRGNPTDVPADHQKIDLPQCLEYLVSRQDCRYVAPPLVASAAKSPSMTSVLGAIRKNVFGDEPAKHSVVHVGAGSI